MSQKINQQLQNCFPEICNKWDQDIIPKLEDYIRIPCKSPAYDKDWKKNGYINQAMQLIIDWCEKQGIAGMKLTLLEDEGYTPLLLIEIDGASDETILFYGHMDKQPEMRNWSEGLGPWTPVIKDDKLYGRGGADDGYAIFCAITAIATLQQQKIPHARCVIIIEATEESGSPDLTYYLKKLKPKIGTPNLVIALDSDSMNYEQLWGTTSLRGLVGGTLTIQTMTQGVHSGIGSGVAPSVFMVLQQLLNRIHDPKTGQLLLPEFQVEIPEQRQQQAKVAADSIGDEFYKSYPFAGSTQPISTNVAELILNRTWQNGFAITGIEGLPALSNAGNVAIPELKLKLSVRLPPTCQVQNAVTALKNALEKDAPYHACVKFEVDDSAPGWHSPILSDWLAKANDEASQTFYGRSAAYAGGGGTIPFMGMLGEMFPQAQFLITGVLGPKSNAHGPNEFLHIPMVKRLTGCVASIVAAHFTAEK